MGPTAGWSGTSSTSPATTAGPTASAPTRLQRLQLRQQHRRRDLQLRGAGQRLAQQHGSDQPAAREGCRHLAEQQRGHHRHPGDRGQRRADDLGHLRLRRRPGVRPQVACLLRQQGDLGRLEQQPAVHRPDERRRHELHRHQPVPAEPGHAAPPRAAVRPGRCALHDRVGQRLQRRQRRLRRSTGSTTSRATAPPSPGRRPTRPRVPRR